MEATRVVAVQRPDGSVGPGSGYVIAARLVLTSAHAVPPARTPGPGGAPDPEAQVQVLVAADPVPYSGVVVWRGTPGGRDDAALVEVDDPRWRPRSGRVRWGRVVTNRPGIACQVWGFPDWVQRQGRAADTAQPSGTLNPGDRYVGDRYVMTLTGHPPAPAVDGSSPWGGLSGAGLFCGHLLTGVVAADPAGAQHARLEAVPISLLGRDDQFRAVLAGHGVAEMVLEPVELQDLIETEPDLVRAPASLLRAQHQVVPFRGRARLLDQLTTWAAGSGFAACLLHGPGGQGKTRLAQELARRLSQDDGGRWAWLGLRRDTPAEELAVLGDAATPLLVIVDYAETRPGQVAAAVRAAARHPGIPALRMLLLARTAGDWWDSLRATDPVTAELLDGTPVARLDPLEPEPAGQAAAYREAVHGLAAALPHLPGQGDHDWAAIASRLTDPPGGRRAGEPGSRLRWQGEASALKLHMTALADLLDCADLLNQTDRQDAHGGRSGKLVGAGPGPVEDRLLHHEQRYWAHSADRFGLTPVLSEYTLRDALTAAFLVGAADAGSADALLHRIPALRDQPRDRRDTVRRWIADLYPPPPGDVRPWDSLQPDRLAERFVGKQLITDPALADHLVAGADAAQATQLLIVYARAAHHTAATARLGLALTDLVLRHADTLAIAAIPVATQVESPAPLITALRRLAADLDTPLNLLTKLTDRLPQTSHRLADTAAALTGRLTDIHRSLASQDAHFRPALARWLNNLSVRLADLGRREEALAASTEATDVYRELAAARPDAFRPALAMSLNNLSVRLAELGRREEALAAVTETTAIRRELAAARPDAFRPDLAMSLNNLSLSLAGLGRREEALAAVIEATDVYRELAAARPDASWPDLAMSLYNLSVRLADLGRREEALAAITEATAAYRELAARWPDVYQDDHRDCLDLLAQLEGG